MKSPRSSTILLASRDRQLLYLIQRYAGNCGCQLIHTEYGSSIFKAIENDPPDVILLDVSHTNREGRIALDELKSQAGVRSIPIILCATSEMDWLDCEAEGRLLQPILFSDFVNAITEIGTHVPLNTKEAGKGK